MHEALILEDGEAVDAVAFCSPACYRRWRAVVDYDADGPYSRDASESLEWCAACGVRCGSGEASGYDPALDCDGSCLPVVVNLVTPGEPIGGDPLAECPHGLNDYMLAAVDPAVLALYTDN